MTQNLSFLISATAPLLTELEKPRFPLPDGVNNSQDVLKQV